MSVQPFEKSAVFNRFDCGRTPLDRFLKNKAKKADRRLEQRVFIATLDGSPQCIGYYALRIGADNVLGLPEQETSYIQNHIAFPAVHLSHLAVTKAYQRQGLGRLLLMNAFDKVAKISDYAGVYAFTLQSLDDESTAFYESIGFTKYMDGHQPKMLYPIQDLLKLVRG